MLRVEEATGFRLAARLTGAFSVGSLVCREGNRTRNGNPTVRSSQSEVSTMQPSSPLAFVGTFLVALLALLALLIPVIERVTQLATE